MKELQTKTAVLVLQYDANNTYGEKASERARSMLRREEGIVELASDVFIIDFEKAFHFVTGLVISEDRLFAGAADARHLQFVLVPCQSPVVGALTEELKKQLDALGLKNWEIGYPEEPRKGGR
jgi:hypothetical protein